MRSSTRPAVVRSWRQCFHHVFGCALAACAAISAAWAQPEPPGALCCNARPAFLSPTDFPGTVGVQTFDAGNLSGPGSEVVVMYDLDERAGHMPPAPSCVTSAFGRFEAAAPWNLGSAGRLYGPTWTKGNLGSVFGVCIDDQGNTYVAHTSSYSDDGGGSGDRLGSLAGPGLGAGAGAIYRLDTNTGAASLFTKLPNNPIVGCSLANPVDNECYPGLGNITFDCEHRQFFVSNFQDGRIYRLRQSDGAVLSTYKHSTRLVVPGNTLDPFDTAGFVPITPDSTTGRGRRVWAVEEHNGRLYYSVWREDFPYPFMNQTCGRPDATHDNEIWSIDLDLVGEFVPGTDRLEVVMPPHVATANFRLNTPPACASALYPVSCSSPVSDISFDRSGCLLAAQRSMDGDTRTSAHVSRVVQFCPTGPGGAWVQSNYGTYRTGCESPPNFINQSNSAGGVDCDLGPIGRVWNSADAMAFLTAANNIYGMQGFPPAPTVGGGVCDSACVDSDNDSMNEPKFKQGSVAVSCARDCSVIENGAILCNLDGTGGVTWTFTITNNSGETAFAALLAAPLGSGVTFSPSAIPLPPLPNGASTTITTTIRGASPGQLCFDITLLNHAMAPCCTLRDHCITIPDCSCGEVRNETLVCVGPGTYAYSFDLVNLSGMGNQRVFLIAPLGSGLAFNPDSFGLASLLPHLGILRLTTTVTGSPGSTYCFEISLHDEHLVECCSFIHCITLPAPCECAGDLNGDGVVDFLDLSLMLANYGQSGGVTACDINGDGVVDFHDLNMLLSAYGLPC